MSETKKKSTVTVRMSWFSSNPLFEEVLNAVKREMGEANFLSFWAIDTLRGLLPLNGSEPFSGKTHFGPHTHIVFEASSLASAVNAADIIEFYLRHKFHGTESDPTFLGFGRTFAGKNLFDVINGLEKAVGEAQKDLKGTRRFLPSKKLQALRIAFDSLHT